MALPDHDYRRKFTYSDYAEWETHDRFELIDGEPYAMSPAPASRHQILLMDLSRQFATALLGKPCQPIASPIDVRLHEEGQDADDATFVVQPDLVVVCDKAKIDEKGVRGAPDFALEILSPSSKKMDLQVKRNVYERFGVKEYWIVDPVAKTVDALRLGPDGRWRAAVRYGAEERAALIEALPELTIDLAQAFSRV